MFWLQSGEDDVSQFDTKFTKQTPIDSPDDSFLSESVNQIFSGFTYVAPSVFEALHKDVLNLRFANYLFHHKGCSNLKASFKNVVLCQAETFNS